jgi:hypothetical protein
MTRGYALLLACWALAGCQTVVTTNPIVPDSAAVADPRLLGTWLDSSRLVVTQGGPRDYLIAERGTRNDSVVVYRGRLGRQGPRWLLDVSPSQSGVEDLLIPGHMLFVLEFGDQEVRFLVPRADSLQRHLEDGRLRLPFLTLDLTLTKLHDIVVTASTQQLTSSLSGYLARPGVLDTVVLQRLRDR